MHSQDFRKQLAATLLALLGQLQPATLDKHVAKKKGGLGGDAWEPPCKLATRRLQKLVANLMEYEVSDPFPCHP